MSSHSLISIILVNYNGADVLIDCLVSLEKFIPIGGHEIIIVDNKSQDNSINIVSNLFPDVKLIRLPKNIGFGAGNNAGVKVAKGEFLFFLNTDTIFTSNIIPHLMELISEDSHIGIVGPKLLFPDGTFQISFAPKIGIRGEFLSKKMHENSQNKNNLKIIEREIKQAQEVDIIVGAAFLIRSNLFNLLGGFDENFFMYFEESDLCQRARDKGYKILYTPHVSLIHAKGHSVKKLSSRMALEYRRSQLYYYQKHCPAWEILVLKIYLVFKFSCEYLKMSNSYSLGIIKLVFTYK
jgi:GT2 family glycosyltransferase